MRPLKKGQGQDLSKECSYSHPAIITSYSFVDNNRKSKSKAVKREQKKEFHLIVFRSMGREGRQSRGQRTCLIFQQSKFKSCLGRSIVF